MDWCILHCFSRYATESVVFGPVQNLVYWCEFDIFPSALRHRDRIDVLGPVQNLVSWCEFDIFPSALRHWDRLDGLGVSQCPPRQSKA